MKTADKLALKIESMTERKEAPRGYLGASSLGKKCSRELWYNFRWAAEPQFPARVLRIFERGNREEKVFEKLLVDAGIQYWPHDPATGDQYLVTFANKHVGGHSDGQGTGLPDLDPNILFLGEFKTHNDKSFKDVVKNGVRVSKPVHYTQMQLYMSRLEIEWGLYGAVNKNDDDLYWELVARDEAHAEYHIQRADMIIDATTPPERINENPGWWECKFCDFRAICHLGAYMDETCRSCVHSAPLRDGDWWCGQYDKRLSISEQQAGCQDHVSL